MAMRILVARAVAACGLAATVTMALSPGVETREASPVQAAQTAPAAAAAPQAPAPPAAGRGSATQADHPANAAADFSPKPPVVALSPADQVKQFWLPPGYRLEPVLSDPLIDSPAHISFDGNGRMYVLELRGYTQTPDGLDILAPVGRVSRHEDRDNDGTFEHHTVFVDNLLFPRFAMPLGANAILTMETNEDEVWKITDTNGDGVGDTKELFTANFGRGGHMEQQQSGLFWAMDNWMYSTANPFRIRWTPDGTVLREPTGPNSGQWSVTQDNQGKVWFQHGSSGLPGYFQLPVHYGNFAHPAQFEPDLNILWGAPVLVGDMMAGLPATRLPDGSVIYSTGAAGNDIFRGHRMPADLSGDYLYGEVAGRIVRRLRPVKNEGLTQLRNVYTRSEFIRSLDPLFRPVDIATGPDGVIYIADMYRGVIEGAPWARTGTYLRKKIEQYQLDKVLGHGRIWRLTYDGIGRDTVQPRMLDETAAQLVGHLSHANGWWRDTAQQLLVLRQDRSVVPALQQIARSSANPLARVHALWTLEGLGALDAALVRAMLDDPAPEIRIQAIRASETLFKAGDTTFTSAWRAAADDRDADVAIQALLTMQLMRVPELTAIVQRVTASNPAAGVRFVGERILNPPANFMPGRGGGGPFTGDAQQSFARGGEVYSGTCFSCHGEDGRGTPAPGPAGELMAPSIVENPRVAGHGDYVIKTLLHGLTGPIDARSYPQVMVPMGTNTDQWIADVATYIRNSFGNSASVVSAADVARVRAATTGRTEMWTQAALESSLPRPLVADASWRATASHNSNQAAGALERPGLSSTARWNSGIGQTGGIWFQVELPQATRIAGIEFESVPQNTFPRTYRVEVSMDGATWSAPVATGSGAARVTSIAFAPVEARFVRITQTTAVTINNVPVWSIGRLRLFEPPPSASAR
jgi:putative membrane-bound dehydrogenase-like protein